mmetsp:Transcript_8057/g.23710  ORF Transcript_8057/g.23710 Transcript_8057/m.23710 type:complete len:310 (-) Transcript_8057:87-1016(-)
MSPSRARAAAHKDYQRFDVDIEDEDVTPHMAEAASPSEVTDAATSNSKVQSAADTAAKKELGNIDDLRAADTAPSVPVVVASPINGHAEHREDPHALGTPPPPVTAERVIYLTEEEAETLRQRRMVGAACIGSGATLVVTGNLVLAAAAGGSAAYATTVEGKMGDFARRSADAAYEAYIKAAQVMREHRVQERVVAAANTAAAEMRKMEAKVQRRPAPTTTARTSVGAGGGDERVHCMPAWMMRKERSPTVLGVPVESPAGAATSSHTTHVPTTSNVVSSEPLPPYGAAHHSTAHRHHPEQQEQRMIQP